MWNSKNQNDSALLSALLIMAIIMAIGATIATTLIVSQRWLFYQSNLITNRNQLYLNLQCLQDWAEIILFKIPT